MTHEEFDAWVRMYFRSRTAAARALDMHPDTITIMATGQRRDGRAAKPVPKAVALACAALAMGVTEYHGGRVTLGIRAASDRQISPSDEAEL